MYSIIHRTNAIHSLVLASRASRLIAGLGIGGTLLSVGTFGHHDLKAGIAASGILVSSLHNNGKVNHVITHTKDSLQALKKHVTSYLSRKDTRSITGVSLVRLEGVEVTCRTGGIGVPHVVYVLLGHLIPKFAIVRTVFEVELGGHASVHGWDKCGGGCHDGDGDDFGQLKEWVHD